jgi:DNA topoisomerase-1
LLSQSQKAEEPLGMCPETGRAIYLKTGRFGPYVQRAAETEDDKPQNASLLKGMRPEDIDLATAVKLLSLPRTLGPHPTSGESVVVHNGRFGPYVKSGAETRSLPAGVSPLDVEMPQALELLAQPKAQRRGFGAKREPVKTLENSPVTQQQIQLLNGRYGMYLTDGVTNASLPKNMQPEEVTQEVALSLLAERAAMGPPKKKARGRGAKAAAAPKAATKKAAKKAPAKKRAAKKKLATDKETVDAADAPF